MIRNGKLDDEALTVRNPQRAQAALRPSQDAPGAPLALGLASPVCSSAGGASSGLAHEEGA